MAASISATLIPCLKLFNRIQEIVEQSNYEYEEDVSSVAWTDELGRLRITKLLKNLDDILNDIEDELSDVYVEALEIISSSNDEQVWSDDENCTPEIRQLYEEVVNIVDCLYKMSMLIRRPAQHDILLESNKNDAAAFEPFDREHVRNKYPDADDVIIERLGRAITQRRKYLKYRDRHHAKLGKGIDEVQCIQSAQATVTHNSLSETIATDFQNPNINFEETTSDSGVTQTSYAPSLTEGESIMIPPPPKESAAGKPFECPYCFFLIEVNGKRPWTRHIVKDMKPYVCMFSDCSTPDRLFESRREWFCHTITKHDVIELTCPLCKGTLTSMKHFERHVARHLEELALFALPRDEMDDESGEDGLDGRASSNESHVHSGSVGSESSDEDDQADVHAAEPLSCEAKNLVDIGNDQAEQSSEHFNQNLVGLRELIDADIELCRGRNYWERYKAIAKVYNDSLHSPQLADLCQAVLDGNATLEQKAEYDTRIQRKILAQIGVDPWKAPDSEVPDVLNLRYKGTTYPLCFNAWDLAEGQITVGEVRRQAALTTGADDPRRISLIYEGKLLKDDHRATSMNYLNSCSEIELLITDIGK